MAVFKGVAVESSQKRKGGNRKSRKQERSKLCKVRAVIAAATKGKR